MEHPRLNKAVSQNLSDRTIGGVKEENDVASNAFISMLEELEIHRSMEHNERRPEGSHLNDPGFFAARPVTRSEYASDTNAMEAYWKEWKNLESKNVWRWETLTEWDTVSAKARREGTEIHLGFLFGFMVEKSIGISRR